ncbi:MAG: hypothetical protein OWS74_02800, partial [Firmicutes bacterium]|nr:hypothetical protein [Bacillota bacterium]
LMQADQVLGILPNIAEGSQKSEGDNALLAELIQRREEARQSGQYAQADWIRDFVKTAGYVIEDTPQGPVVSTTGSVKK